jgi:hypothetical protein
MQAPVEKKIEITVSPAGAVSIKTSGFPGDSCRDATKDIERALGIAGAEALLPEFYARQAASQQVQQGQ